MKMRAFCDIAPCSLRVDWRFRGVYYLHHHGDDSCISYMSVYSETTWSYIPEGSHLHTRCCEDLKSHILKNVSNKSIMRSVFYAEYHFLYNELFPRETVLLEFQVKGSFFFGLSAPNKIWVITLLQTLNTKCNWSLFSCFGFKHADEQIGTTYPLWVAQKFVNSVSVIFH
jgi:hypothetical protein